MRVHCCQALASPKAHSCERAQVSGNRRYSRGFGACNRAISRKSGPDRARDERAAVLVQQKRYPKPHCEETRMTLTPEMLRADNEIPDMLWPFDFEVTDNALF